MSKPAAIDHDQILTFQRTFQAQIHPIRTTSSHEGLCTFDLPKKKDQKKLQFGTFCFHFIASIRDVRVNSASCYAFRRVDECIRGIPSVSQEYAGGTCCLVQRFVC